MKHSALELLLLVTISNVTPTLLAAQSRQPLARGADVARLRTEKAAARQRNALMAMAESVAGQRSSVERRNHNPPLASSFDFLPDRQIPVGTSSPCESLPAGEVKTLVAMAAERTSVSPQLIRSVMRQESAFRPCAVSAKGAMGLMQLMPGTASDLGVTNAFDPEANILGGATLLRQLLDRYGGDLNLTLSAYNAGPARVDAVMGVPSIPETVDYVRQILSHLTPSPLLKPTAEQHNLETDDYPDLASAPAISLRLTDIEGGE